MASHRAARGASDAVVHERMKRHRVSIDKATSVILRKLEGSSSSARRPANDIDRPYREKRRYPTHDSPRGSSDRSWDVEARREGKPAYLHERGPPGGRNFTTFSDRQSFSNSYREQLNAKKRRLCDPENSRSVDWEDYMFRDLSRRSGDFDRPLGGPDYDVGWSDIYRVSRPRFSKLHPFTDIYRSPAAKSQVPIKHREKKGPHRPSFGSRPPKPYEASTKEDIFDPVSILHWAQFYSIRNDFTILKQRVGPLQENTVSLQMMIDCFKRPMSFHHRKLCFTSIKPLTFISALKSPIVDADLLDLLVSTKTVAAKSDFFEAIQPFDRQMNILQQGLLKCATPLLMVSQEFELQQGSPPSSSKRLQATLRNTVLQCQRAMVLIGQTYSTITHYRQAKILGLLGINDVGPIKYPNVRNCFLFGEEFINKLKEWLKDKDNKLIFTPPANLAAKAYVAEEEDLETEAESQVRKAADPKFVAEIDELLEDAKNVKQADGQKSQLWYFFDEGSNEYKYYHHKFKEFQKSKGGIGANGSQNRTCGRSPEDLACESVRAMRYARKVQALKRKLRRSLAFSRKRKAVKLRRCAPKAAPPVKVEEGTEEEQQQLELAPTEINEEVEVKPQIAPNKCSTSDSTEAKKDAASPEKKEPADAPAGEVDEKTKDTAIKLAQFVAQMGPEIEQFSKENSVNNPEFWFLCNKESPAYKFYRSKVEEFKQAEEEDATSDDGDIGLDDDDLENIRTGDEPQNDSDLELDAECEAAEAPSAETTSVAAFAQMPTPARPPIARKRVSNLKVGMLPPKRVCLVEEPKQHDPVRIEYDRPRGRGNRRRKPADLEFADKKINQQNVGFQMLSKMGWRDGQGLGPGGSGIKNPVNVGTVSAGEGLGADEKKAGKSANFDAFRQRMIQMYRKLPSNKAQKD